MTDNVIQLRDEQTGLSIFDADMSGDERLCTWIKAAAGVASALGIRVVIEPNDDGRVNIHAEAIRPMLNWKDLRGS